MNAFPTGDVTVMEMMQARDERALRQQRLMPEGGALVCLTMNIPGPRKTSPMIYAAFQEGKRLIASALPQAVFAEQTLAKTGFEVCYLLPGDVRQAKRVLCALEDESPLGRLFDIDVLSGDGQKMSREELGFPPRKCFLCGQPAFVCARSRAHSVADMMEEINRRIAPLYREQTLCRLSRAAVEALEREARTTPKPGLVDERNCGSHPDMNLTMLLSSAKALEGYFARCAQLGFDCREGELFPALQAAGVQAEEDMLSVTGGVNTHKGAIFSLGILCAASARCAADFQTEADAVLRKAGDIARPEVERYLASITTAHTFGEKLYLQQGIRGIRGEAADGFPALRDLWPVFQKEAEQLSLNEAGVRAIIRLLSHIQDTTLVKRGGAQGESFARAQAQRIERNGFAMEEIIALDDEMIARRLTCGGCADLLACLFFLHATAWNAQSPENLP